MNKIIIAQILEISSYIFLIILFCFLFDNKKQQSDVWLAPYFSGAANLGIDLVWKYSIDECLQFQEFNQAEKKSYRFKKQSESKLKNYDFNSKGFLYCVYIARNLFICTSDIKSIEYLQISIYIILNILLLKSFNRRWHKLSFLALFTLNPLIIYFVTFPYNFFWQIVPGISVVYLLIRKNVKVIPILFLSLLLGLTVITRPSTIFIITGLFLIFLLLSHVSKGLKIVSISLFMLTAVSLSSNTKKNPWFTMYVGLGAYENSYVDQLSDDEGYKRFEEVTGTKLNASFNGNYYEDDIQENFYTVFKESYLNILRNNPFLVLKNATMNTLQGFSIGYINKQPDWVNYIISLSGLLFFILLLIYRQFLIVALILLTIGGFTPYFPPIQAYMFGAYPILVVGAIILISKIFNLSQITDDIFLTISFKNQPTKII